MSGPRRSVIVTGLRQLTPRIREFLITSADGQALPRAEPGAHVQLHLPADGGGPVLRHYSIIGGVGSWDDTPTTYRIAVQRGRGRGSAQLHDAVGLGAQLAISPPVNCFPLDRTDTHSLLIAGGIGITPIYAMARSLARRRRSFSLLYVGRNRDDLAYREDMLRLAGPGGQVHLTGPFGRPDLRGLLADQPHATSAYVCGPPGMVAAVHDAATSLGWPAGRVASESFGGGPADGDVAFEVELHRSGRVLQVSRDATILDTLDAAGIHAMSDCRRGECGLCPLPVLRADGPIIHRDRILSETARAAGRTLCICVSRLHGGRLVLDA